MNTPQPRESPARRRGEDVKSADDIDRVAGWLAGARQVAVLTGAGISTDSGIPDFRGPSGLWTRDPDAARMFTLQDYVADPQIRRRVWQARREHPAWTAEPNAGHRALVDLERAGRLGGIVTQNIDGLHQRAGNSAERVIEIHGTLFEVECLDCDERTAMTAALERVAAGEQDPACACCGGILKAATISFGQSLHGPTLRRAVAVADECDLMLAIGTTLTVHPAAGLVEIAAEAGAPIVIINAAATPYDPIAGAVLREPIGVVLPRLVAAAGLP